CALPISDKRSLELWKLNIEAYELGLELIKPGAVAQEVAATINRFFEDHDLLQYAPIGYGHSFGVMSPYYGREAAMEFREDIETVVWAHHTKGVAEIGRAHV